MGKRVDSLRRAYDKSFGHMAEQPQLDSLIEAILDLDDRIRMIEAKLRAMADKCEEG